MKKILIVANVAKEHVLKFHIPLIKMLKEDGWIVHVACSGKEKIPYCDKKWEMNYDRSPFSIKTTKSIFELKKIIDNENYDVVHCHTPTGGLVARLASIKARKNGLKVIYTAHGYHFYQGAPLLNWLLYFPIEWLLSYLTDCIITINEEDYKNTLKYNFGCNQVEKINGVGVEMNKFEIKLDETIKKEYREKFGLNDDTLVLIYVAELIPNKNQAYLIEMLDKLKDIISDVCLLLVGPDHCNGLYMQLAEKLGISDKVKFLGWRYDIPELLTISDIVVASSIREGLGLNLVEAMTVGIPIVAVRNRGHCEIIKDGINGFLVEQWNIEDMIEKILLIHNNKEIEMNFIQNGKVTSEQFDSKRILLNLKKIYYEILNSHPINKNISAKRIEK